MKRQREMQKTRFFRVFCMVALIMVVFITTASPAYAGDTSNWLDYREFDYSDVDALDKYDFYAKEITQDGISYVKVSELNRIDTSNPKDVADYRYGAHLRNSTEQQIYSIANSNYGGVLPSNVLTIYADPEVAFDVIDVNGQRIVNSTGNYSISSVKNYEKTTNYEHAIYYIELLPMQTSQSSLLIRFSTSAVDVQPHYSFWFGHPVPVTETYDNIGLLELGILKPNTSTKLLHPLSSTLFPRQSWVTSVKINKVSESDKAWMSSAYFQVLTPDQTTTKLTQNTSSRTAVFNYDVNRFTAYPAYGAYYFRFSKVTWNPNVSGPAYYVYSGNVGVSLIYGLGYR